jgi:cytochrome P450
VFTLRIFHTPVVFMLGPEANHHITVTHAHNFRWREGNLGDLMPLLGDGLLTIDGEFHRRSRQVMLPVFHHERIVKAIDTMVQETERALDLWRDGARLDFYAWTRRLTLRVAMRALFGLDPDAAMAHVDVAACFERALGFYSRDYAMQMLRGPRTPFARMQQARRALDEIIYAEIERRRRTNAHGEDILSLLLDAHDEDGWALSDEQVRDEVMTLLFAGHDTTTSTVAFLFYELAHNPDVAAQLVAERERILGADRPTAEQLMSGALPLLDMVVDETLRLYPPAWVGPRRSVEPFEFAGHHVPGGVLVNYSSWASHHLPGVFDDPERFRPERFSPEARAKLPKGAYVPFGGGSRTCIGMRFGQLEMKAIATLVLARFAVELVPEFELQIRQMPTLSPKGGLPVVVHERGAAPDRALESAA